ncbi:Leucine-rich repeat-containing protein 7 [Triplophysa tibetana]|uniref:Leucine-rich repeat-containing protein 7 n=1 Tax=Triplophysa tibetana TaxID=1572043 RepID=A0A5A9NTR5_9TELE|nr:Leucine-rich repeat-containing protein 7 [Triplophysa tibetana]
MQSSVTKVGKDIHNGRGSELAEMSLLQCLEMTTKRKIIGRLVPCRCFRGEEEVISVLDYSHCSLQQVPKEIFSFERTLEELYLDANQIEELPKQLFSCQALKKLSMPDNDLSSLPTTIASLVNLKELDISKNGIQEFPDSIKCCKCLSVVEASVNPIAKLPDGFTQLLNLTQLFLNDAFLEYLPANFGRSIHRLSQLERLDLGSNEFSEMSIGKLRQLRYLDLAKNRIESLDADISGCESLEDLLLSSNMLQQLPDSIGKLKKLTTLKVDDNQLTSLPNTIGSLSLLEEFDCSCNELESLPPTIGYLHNLRTFAADENFLTELPREIGNCRNVTVMSLRSNKLEFLPDEIGQMTKLRVLNLSDNRLKNLPFTFAKLKDLAALWLSDNQSKALIPLQTEAHPETKQRVLTNYMFPQQPRHDEDYQSDTDSFNPTLWEEQRQQRMTVAFEFEDKKEEEDNSGKVKVEINLKRYPTPYPEDLKNMVKSVQNLVGKNTHPLNTEKCSSGTNMELHSQDKYEHKWPIAPKELTEREVKDYSKPQICDQGAILNTAIDIPNRKDKEDLTESSEDSMGGSPNDIRISDMRPTLVEPAMYKPKVVLLGKEKKVLRRNEQGSNKFERSSPIHYHHCALEQITLTQQLENCKSFWTICMNHIAVSKYCSDTFYDVFFSEYVNRLAQSFPKPIETKPLLSQRETPPSSTLQQRGERRPLSDTFDNWNNAPHYDNTGFVAEETALDTPGSSAGNPMLGSKPRSASISHGRRPLMRQERIVGVPLELDQSQHTFHTVRTTPETEVPAPSNPWQNWTRTPSPFEDRTAFPSKLEITPANSPNPDRKDFEQEMGELPSTFPSNRAWGYLDSTDSGMGRGHPNIFAHVQSGKELIKGGTLVVSKSSERLSPMMKEVKAKFKKSQSIDEIDMGSYKVYSIPLDSYSSSIENQGSVDRSDLSMPMEQCMSRSQSAPMLDDDLDCYGSSKSLQQKPAIPKQVYHFDQSFNPQRADRRVPPPFPNTPEYINQPGKTLPKELISPRGYRGYQPMDQMFSFPQAAVTDDAVNHQLSVQPQRSRPGFLRRADSLVSSTEMALFRRVAENHELQMAEHYQNRPQQIKSMLEQQNSLSNMADTQFHKRNGRYEDDYSSYQEPKKPITGYPTKSLTQRRPLSARSYSTETYGASQARPVSARPTMAALLEKLPSDYNLSSCTEKSPDADMKMRPIPQKPEDMSSKMPIDWRQQLLRHIEAKRLDRSAVLKHNTVNFGMLYSGGYAAPHASRSMTINFYNNTKHENQTTQWLPPPNSPSQQSNILDNGQEVVSPSSQWAPYSLGRRDVPPESMNIIKKPGVHNPHQQQTMMITSAPPPHRTARDQQYEGAINKVSIQQYQSPLPMPITTTSPRPQSARCFIQTKGQKSMDGFPEQLCVRIEKNPGLGFSISGGISGQGNPFKPSDMGIFVTRVQPDGPAFNVLRPGDKILKANGHSFLHMEHETAVSLLKNFPKTVDLVILRESTT